MELPWTTQDYKTTSLVIAWSMDSMVIGPLFGEVGLFLE